MRPSGSGSASSTGAAISSSGSSSAPSPAFRHQKPRLMVAPVCWRHAWPHPMRHWPIRSEASERGAQSAMSEEVLVPQAKSKSEVPAMRKRSPATKDAAAAGSTPMNSAPVMNRSPRMPPRPFGSGQLFGWGRADSAAASSITDSGHSSRRARRRSGTVRSARCQPHAASGRNSTIAASPKDCMARSARMAPHEPSTLRGAACVALLKLGS